VNTAEGNIDLVVELLAGYRLRFGTELQLQDDIEAALGTGGLHFAREHCLSGADRIDFYLSLLGIGIECKTEGSISQAAAQLLRYAKHTTILGLVLVSRRRGHQLSQTQLGGKPFRMLWVGGGSL
jgi:hypothetical protein